MNKPSLKGMPIKLPHILVLTLGFGLGLILTPSAALAAISATDLAVGGASSANIKTATTQSIAPGANRLILAWILTTDNQTPEVPTLSGNGLTWHLVDLTYWNSSGPYFGDNITLWRAMGASPTAGSVTISYSSGQQSIAWSIAEFSGVDTSGTDGSGAFVQSATGTDDAAGPSGLTITLPSAIGSGNATAGGFGNAGALAASISPGIGYTAFSEIYLSGPQSDLRAEWRADGNATVNATQSGSFPMGGIAIEIRAAGAAPALALVKQIWDSAGVNCLASIPADTTCNGSATSVTVPSGITLMVMIYIRNTNGTAANDVRFQDLLDDSVSGFTYTASSIKQTPNDGTAPADTASNATILAAATTAQTDAVGAPDDFASITDSNANGQLDKLTVGAVTGQANQSLSFQANKTFAVVFQVAKN